MILTPAIVLLYVQMDGMVMEISAHKHVLDLHHYRQLLRHVCQLALNLLIMRITRVKINVKLDSLMIF